MQVQLRYLISNAMAPVRHPLLCSQHEGSRNDLPSCTPWLKQWNRQQVVIGRRGGSN